MKRIDMAGERFGRLLVVTFAFTKRREAHWMCQCDCGRQSTVIGSDLRKGHTKSCGCAQHEGKRRTHGQARKGSESTEYSIWRTMLARCSNPTVRAFPDYGGRGIKVCERWRKFENFYADMGPRPSASHSIDRINNDGNYELGNCRWATRKEQGRNTRTNRLLTFRGETLTLSQWAEKAGFSKYTVNTRLRQGWTVERALTQPICLERRNTRATWSHP